MCVERWLERTWQSRNNRILLSLSSFMHARNRKCTYCIIDIIILLNLIGIIIIIFVDYFMLYCLPLLCNRDSQWNFLCVLYNVQIIRCIFFIHMFKTINIITIMTDSISYFIKKILLFVRCPYVDYWIQQIYSNVVFEPILGLFLKNLRRRYLSVFPTPPAL